jgi:hypothetical protein
LITARSTTSGAFGIQTRQSGALVSATSVLAIVRLYKSFAHLIVGIFGQGIMGIQVSEWITP